MSDAHKFDFDGIKYRVESRPPMIFVLLFSVLIVWGVCFMGYYLFSGWSSVGEYTRDKKDHDARLAAQKPAATQPSAAEKTGDKTLIAAGGGIFTARCAVCHGADAKGKIGPDLTRKEFKYGRSAESVRQSIAEGRPGGMPSFKNDLASDKIEAVVQYLLSL